MWREVRWFRVGARLALVAAGAAGAVSAASAQLPIEAWVRPVAALPLGDFANRDRGIEARASFGFDAGAALSLGALTVYGEYQEIEFGCDECGEVAVSESVLDRGWDAGAMIPYPRSWSGFEPWVRAGVVGHHLRFRFEGESAYSDPAIGWSLGIGAKASPLRWLRISPSLLYRSYDAQHGFSIDVPDRRSSVSYLTLGLGIGVAL